MNLKVGMRVRFKPYDKSWEMIDVSKQEYNTLFKNKTHIVSDLAPKLNHGVCPRFNLGYGRWYTLPSHCLPLEVKSNKPLWF